MQPRLNFYTADPASLNAMLALEKHLRTCGFPSALYELVRIRASQINGCAFCLDMHTRDARAHGETEQRLHLLAAWRESPLFTDRERAALAWTEALTLVAQSHAPDDAYAAVRAHFDDRELVQLSLLIGAINTWNRLAIGFRSVHPVAAPPAA